MVRDYDAFSKELRSLGFILFGGGHGHMLDLGDITDPKSWHTQAIDTDPWDWKDRLAQSREGAYMRVMDGRATLIDRAWIPVFIAAYGAQTPLEERYEAGQVDRLTFRMHELFEQRPQWPRHELTQALGIDKKQKSAFARALVNLQGEMAIVISGQEQKIAMTGMPMGWPSMCYQRTDAWAEPEWLDQAEAMSRDEARLKIRERILQISPQCPPRTLERLCGMGATGR